MKIEKLGNVFKITSGGTPNRSKTEYYENGTIPWVKTGDLKVKDLFEANEYVTSKGLENSSAKIFPKNTILIAMYGATIGACSILRIEAATNQACAALLPNEKVDTNYLYYYLMAIKPKLIDKGVGGGQPNISGTILKEIEFPFPDLKIQREIANVLEQADKARQQRKAANALTDEFLQSSFLSLFGDPVKNEKGWEMKKLGELVESFKYGTNQKSTEYSTEGIPVLRIPNVIGSKIDYTELKYAILPNKEKEDTKLQKGDLLFVRSNGNPNYIGRCAVFSDEIECCYASYLIRARIMKSSKIDSKFIQFVMSFKTYRPLVLKKAKTTAGNYNINTESLKSFDIPVPPLSLQQQFAGIVAQAEQLRQKQKESEQELENLFQGLLQKYFG